MEVDRIDDTDDIVIDVFDEISRRLGSTYSGFVNYSGYIGDEIRCLALFPEGPFYTVDHLDLHEQLVYMEVYHIRIFHKS
uniref:Uncharacterized protein n=1 Tax=Oryza sativa subsp. japonica TaxID=39947 RepID=Q67W04_ORYSJ|nr:hypothetical protein [Oryza sativa Japonica Group]BAD37665.1 hypothetical protein [Oryza sativa Japonica Group]